VALKRDSVMMLSSDGLHGVVPEEEIEQILNESQVTFQDKCHELISAANAAGSPDNVTVLLIRRAA
jgi:serine/threonine protein phosphatase PrpC